MYAIHPHYLNSSDLVPGVVYLSRPYLVSGLAAVSWPSLTRVVSGQRRGQDEEMFTFVCNMQQEPAQLSSHPVSGFEDNAANSNLAQFDSMSKNSIELIVAVQLN